MIHIGYKRWGEGMMFWIKLQDQDKIPAWEDWKKRNSYDNPLSLAQRLREDRPVRVITLDESGPFSKFTRKKLEAIALLLGVRKGFKFIRSNTY